MTHAPPDPLARLSHTLRRGSDRERRMLGLCWLLGWRAATIAAHLGCHVPTVHRRMRAFDLRGAEQPGERERLLQGALRDRLADDLMAGSDLMKLAPQIARHAPAAAAATPSPSTEPVDTHDNDDLNGDWRKCAARLRAGRELVDRQVP